ncbi:MAG: hypothetical protein F6K30_24940 [Cyanothece sp. SIO2G6]|nr:hypothetical protein [Cyanothece sp. SIO2G6]
MANNLAIKYEVVEAREYDVLNRLVSLEHTINDQVIAGYEYTLDAAGNRTGITEANGQQMVYTYDDLYRVLTETITDDSLNEVITTYSYDAIGNRLFQNHSTEGLTTYTYDDNSRLLTETQGDAVTEYTYDNNGNTLSVTGPTESKTYQWNDENELVQAEITDASGTQQVSYDYDANGVRVSQTVDGTKTQFLVDTNRSYAAVIEEYTAAEEPLVVYTYGDRYYAQGHDLIAQHRGEDTHFYHADALGSTRILTDSDGAVTDSYMYDAYGKLISSLGDTENSYLYTGEQFDEALDEYYLRARYYDPDSGRFISRDPFEGLLSDPLSLAKYPYVHGNPVNATDPSGLFKFDTVVGPIIQSILNAIPTVTPKAALIGAGLVDSFVAANWVSIAVTAGATSVAVAAELTRRKFPLLVHSGGNLKEHAEHIEDTQKGRGNTSRRVRRLEELQRERPNPPDQIDSHIEKGSPIPLSLQILPHPIDIRGFYAPVRVIPDRGREFIDQTLRPNGRLGGRTPHSVARDEFPFVSTARGGTPGYDLNRVSLRYVPQSESNRQGGLISTFYAAAGVNLNDTDRANNPIRGRFFTISKPNSTRQSGYYRRDRIGGYIEVGGR